MSIYPDTVDSLAPLGSLDEIPQPPDSDISGKGAYLLMKNYIREKKPMSFGYKPPVWDTLILSCKTHLFGHLLPVLGVHSAIRSINKPSNIIGEGGAAILAVLMAVGYSIDEIYHLYMGTDFTELIVGNYDKTKSITRKDQNKDYGLFTAEALGEWINSKIDIKLKAKAIVADTGAAPAPILIDVKKMSSKELAEVAKTRKVEEKKEAKEEKKAAVALAAEAAVKYTFKQLYEATKVDVVIPLVCYSNPALAKADDPIIGPACAGHTPCNEKHIAFLSAKTTPNVTIADAVMASIVYSNVVQPVDIGSLTLMNAFATYSYPIEVLNDKALFNTMPVKPIGFRVIERNPAIAIPGKYSEMYDRKNQDDYVSKNLSRFALCSFYPILTPKECSITTDISVESLHDPEHDSEFFPYIAKDAESDKIIRHKSILSGIIGAIETFKISKFYNAKSLTTRGRLIPDEF